MNSNEIFLHFRNYFSTLPSLQQAGFFLWPSLAGESLTEQENALLKQIQPSGLILFKRNLSSVEQSKNLISQARSLLENSNSPFSKNVVICIDEEGGRVSRLPPPHERGKSALHFADTKRKKELKELVELQCKHAQEIGINCLLAPVADILTEPNNPVMGDRCFGRDEKVVSDYASFVHEIILSHNLYSCAKHFPGHGNTLTDSHKDLSTSDVTLDVLKKREWLPFKTLIQQNVPFVMAAHVLLPHIDKNNPATLSHTILTEQLRGELGFKGLILSDDLRMNAMALHYNVQKKQDSSITEEQIQNSHSLHDDDSYTDSTNSLYEARRAKCTESEAADGAGTRANEQRLTRNLWDSYYLKIAAIDALNAGCDILLSCQSIEKEFLIAESIAKKLTEDKEFLEKMVKKAFHIYSVLSSILPILFQQKE